MEARWCESGRHGLLGELTIVVCFGFGRWDVADGLQQPLMIEPGHPFKGRQLEGFFGLPRSPAVVQFSFLKPVDRFGQRVIVAVALAAHRWFDAGLGQSLTVPNRHVLGGFNRSSQHRVVSQILDIDSVPRLASSNPTFCAVCC